MPYFLEELLAALYQFIADLVAYVLGIVWDAIAPLLGYVVSLFTAMHVWAYSQLPQSWRDTIEGIPWASIVGYYEDVAWILPITEVLAIIFVVFNVTAYMRLIRWVLGLIPTVGG